MKKLLTLALCVTLCMLCMTAASADYTAGTYTGVAAGNNGDIAVEVTFSETEITAIEITSHSETAGISDPAIARIPEAILSSQSLGVDTISGCTMTSKGIIEAVAAAAAQASADVDALRAVEVLKAEAGETVEKTVDVVVVGAGGAGMHGRNVGPDGRLPAVFAAQALRAALDAAAPPCIRMQPGFRRPSDQMQAFRWDFPC